jgi:hypothetical protein
MWGTIAALLPAGAVTVSPIGTTCPSGDAIAAELYRLGAVAALATVGSPEVTVKDKTMQVVLRGQDGSMLGAREVAAPEACSERAAVAAVFIAAWVGAWTTTPLAEGPDYQLAAPNYKAATLPSGVPRPRPRAVDPARQTSPAPREPGEARKADQSENSHPNPALTKVREPGEVAQADPAKPPDAKAAPTEANAKQPAPAVAAETKAVAAAAEKPKRGLQGEVAGLAFGIFDEDAGTFGAGILVGYRPTGALGLAALFEATGERERKLDPGVAGYRTFRLGVGAGVSRKWGRAFGDVGIFPELTLLTLNGKQLAPGRSATAWGAAADLRARFGLAWGRVAPFLFLGGSYALRGERLTLGDRPQTSITLSRWNFSAGAGLAFLFGIR